MRRELVIFAVILAVVLIAGLGGRFLVTGIAVREIKNAFPGYDVSIGGAEVRSADMVAITGIEIKKDKALCYKIRSLEINFSPISLFTRTIPKVVVKDCNIAISAPDKKLKDLIEYPVSKPGKGFMVKSVVISNLIVTLDTADWKFVTIANGDITMGKAIMYNAKINVQGIDLALLPKGLDAAEKLEMKGTMSGMVTLNGEQAKITEIKGEFATAEPGGSLVIKDEDLLKRLAENTKQPLSLIEGSFKHYDFTRGTLDISRNADAIFFHIILDGAKGKRDLTIALHGF